MKNWLKLLSAILLPLVFIGLMAVFACLYFFTKADNYQDSIKTFISSRSGYQIEFGDLRTELSGTQALVFFEDLKVRGATDESSPLTINNFALGLDLGRWFDGFPAVTKLVLEQPELALEVDQDGRLLFAGKPISRDSKNANLKTQIQRFLNLDEVYVHDGNLLWKPFEKETIQYNDLTLVHEKSQNLRKISVSAQTPKGKLRLGGEVQGDPLRGSDWQASLDVFDTLDLALLEAEDFSLQVKDGQGRLRLQNMNLARIYDFATVLGSRDSLSQWLIHSDLAGLLTDIELDFSGPLHDLQTWSAAANLSDMSFKPYRSAPGLSHLQGRLTIDNKQALVQFESSESDFSWPDKIGKAIELGEFGGQLKWRRLNSSESSIEFSDLVLKNATFDVAVPRAELLLTSPDQEIRLFSDFFTQKSLKGIKFEDGKIINSQVDSEQSTGVWLDATAAYDITSINALVDYFPAAIDTKFKDWWKRAFQDGQIRDGTLSFQGLLHKSALSESKAQLRGTADFENLKLKYGRQDSWPMIDNGNGKLSFNQDQLNFEFASGRYGSGDIKSAAGAISNVWQKQRTLQLDAQLEQGLPDVIAFLFDGPFVRSKEPRTPPLVAESGDVVADIEIQIPLSNVKAIAVKGSAMVSNGQLQIGQNLSLSDAQGEIDFTERSVYAKELSGNALGGTFKTNIKTLEEAKPPRLAINIEGQATGDGLVSLVGPHVASFLEGQTDYQSTVLTKSGKVTVDVESDLQGLSVKLPDPVQKLSDESRPTKIRFESGNADIQKTLSLQSGELDINFRGDLSGKNRLIDQGNIRWGEWDSKSNEAGIHLQVSSDSLDLDEWIKKVIQLSRIKSTKPSSDPDATFIGRLRSLKLNAADTQMMGRPFERVRLNSVTTGNQVWTGTISGERIEGAITADFSEPVKDFSAKLSHLYWGNSGRQGLQELRQPDRGLNASLYPSLDLEVARFSFFDRHLGKLKIVGSPDQDSWQLKDFSIEHPSFDLNAKGAWTNKQETGSISEFNSKLSYRGVGDILDDYRFVGFIKNGKGKLDANLKWIGAPHEFDMRRLNGDFDFDIRDGELIKVDAGGGKLLGLLNFNTIFRRLTFDFSDLFAEGLKFDDMGFAGVLGDGDMLLQEGYIYSPSIFLQAEGRVGLAKQDMDLDINVSPELGGNLTLLGAIANPTAGAVMFLSQRLFRSEQWGPTVQRYHVSGPWKEVKVDRQNLSKDEADATNLPVQD